MTLVPKEISPTVSPTESSNCTSWSKAAGLVTSMPLTLYSITPTARTKSGSMTWNAPAEAA